MTNIEIVKQIIDSGNWLNGTAEVSIMSSNTAVQIYTKNVFIRMSELERLRNEIERWEMVNDIEVSPMPLRNNALAITIIF